MRPEDLLIIMAALAGLDFVEPRRPGILSIEGDDTGGGGGGGGEKGKGGGEKKTEGGEGGGGEKTLTQAEVNALLAKERRSLEAKLGQGSKDLETKLAEANAKLEKIEQDKALGETTGKDREILALKQTIARLENDVKSRDEQVGTLKKSNEETTASFRTHRAREVVQAALVEKGAVKSGKALGQAVSLMLGAPSTEITDTDGKLSLAFTIDGKRYEDPLVAAAEWLKNNDHFLAASGGGSGTKGPTNGSGFRRGVALADLSEAELARAAAADDPNR